MRIALFYASWESFGEPWSTPQGLRWELEHRNHEVTPYNLYHANGQLLPKKNIRTYSGDCFNKFNNDYQNYGYRPDAVIVMDYGPYDYVGMDKKYFPDVPFILEAGDTPQSFPHHARKAHKFHSIVTPDWRATRQFQTMGVDAHWMNHWADTRIFHDGYDVEPIYDVVSTCGGRKVTARMNEVLGERFNNERYFFGEEHAKRLMLGNIVFQCSQYGEITRRTFEGMACGRMVLTDRLDPETRMEELFEDGQDIVYYDSADDAIDKVNYYTEHPQERERIAANGKRKVLGQHTVAHRVDVLEDVIERIQNDIIGVAS
jgi:hypothetical protein